MTRDPREGVSSDGTIVTSVDGTRIRAPYDAVVEAAVEVMFAHVGDALDGLYLYGSVATGQARPPGSDLDLYAILVRDVQPACREAAAGLSEMYASIVRDVGVAAVLRDDVLADTLEGKAERCFVRHYCVHLAGRNLQQDLPACEASPALARGFNGNVGPTVAKSLTRLRSGTLDEQEQRHAIAWSARKLLMSAATLLSTRAGDWSTDRDRGAELLTRAVPEMATCVSRVHSWTGLDGLESDVPLPAPGEATACLAELSDWLRLEYEAIPTFDAGQESDVDTESVALAFDDDVRGWPTAHEALEAFLRRHVVTADGIRSPEGAPQGEPNVTEESEGECTWSLSSAGEMGGSVTAVRLNNGWVIQSYSRPA